MMLRVLHICNWYPTRKGPNDAIWIHRQIKTMDRFCQNDVIHLEVIQGKFKIINTTQVLNNKSWILSAPTSKWFVKEILCGLLLFFALSLMTSKKKYDVINFHIAYPLLSYWHWLKFLFRVPVVITEHWSAYHFDFNIKKPGKLFRVKRIFRQGIPVLAVSEALTKDILKFAQPADFETYVVRNVVNTDIFQYRDNTVVKFSFLMVSQWKEPKDPFLAILAFNRLYQKNQNVSLRIGGYGVQEKRLLGLIKSLDLEGPVKYLGSLTSQEVASEMSGALGLIHISEYETFSVVCAEALCCGTPVIASKVGGIVEIVGPEEGILLEDPTEYSVYRAMKYLLNNYKRFKRKKIAFNAAKKFSPKNVGDRYHDVLKNFVKSSGAVG